MPGEPWSEEEIDLIVADYFEMLGLAPHDRCKLNKLQRRAALQQQLKQMVNSSRTDDSIQYKHRNISAALERLGGSPLKGYLPARNYQAALVPGIERYLKKFPSGLHVIREEDREEDPAELVFRSTLPLLQYVSSPIVENADATRKDLSLQRLSAKIDHAENDMQKRKWGMLGENLVFQQEQANLVRLGRSDLADKVRWVSQEDGDGLGYDIRSYHHRSGEERWIEVKTTRCRSEKTPFFLTENERQVAETNSEIFRLVRVFDAARPGPKAFKLRPPLEDQLHLHAINYRASLR